MTMTMTTTLALVILSIAVVTDHVYRRVPNWLILVGLLAAFSIHGPWALVGVGVGLGLGLVSLSPGGDTKLLAVIGGLLGSTFVAEMFLIAVGLTIFVHYVNPRRLDGPWTSYLGAGALWTWLLRSVL